MLTFSTQHRSVGYRHIRLLLIMTLGIGFIVLPGIAHAGSYDVKATVPYPAPTQAAVIDASLDGTTVQNTLFTISGSCQLMNPVGVVSIWRNGTTLVGSTPCNGNFSLQIMLATGQNLLTARTANASALYGPDSQPVMVTLVLPTVTVIEPTPPAAAPSQSTSDGAETPAQQVAATNAGVASDLTAIPTDTFNVMNDNTHATTIHVMVGGGAKPYDITLNWGDGTVESHAISEPGTYDFSHVYQRAGTYKVRGAVHDVLGAATIFEYAVLSSYKSPGVAAALGDPKTIAKAGSTMTIAPATAFTAGGVIIAGAGYWFGLRHAAKVAKVYSQRGTAKPAKRALRHTSRSIKAKKTVRKK